MCTNSYVGYFRNRAASQRHMQSIQSRCKSSVILELTVTSAISGYTDCVLLCLACDYATLTLWTKPLRSQRNIIAQSSLTKNTDVHNKHINLPFVFDMFRRALRGCIFLLAVCLSAALAPRVAAECGTYERSEFQHCDLLTPSLVLHW